MSVKRVRDALCSACERVYHYSADPKIKSGYAVWGETGQRGAFSADDMPECVVIGGEAYYYTDVEYDECVSRICSALSEAGVSWSITSMGYDDSLGQFVVAWGWEVCCGTGEIY